MQLSFEIFFFEYSFTLVFHKTNENNIQLMPSVGKYAKVAKYGKRESWNSLEDQFWFYVEV